MMRLCLKICQFYFTSSTEFYDESTERTGCVRFSLEDDFNNAGVDVAAGPPAALDINGLRALVPPATALRCIASCSPGSSDVGSADTLPV